MRATFLLSGGWGIDDLDKGVRIMKYRKNGTDAVCGQCDLCGGELRRGERYYRISGENVCRGCLADFAAQILAAYEVVGGEADA